MTSCFRKKELRRVLLAHILGLTASAIVICMVMCCHRRKTPAEKIRRAFKELEEKFES